MPEETFFTDGEATSYGDSPALGTLGDSLSEQAAACRKLLHEPHLQRPVPVHRQLGALDLGESDTEQGWRRPHSARSPPAARRTARSIPSR